MRIGSHTVVQQIEPGRVVILDEVMRQEIEITEELARRLLLAMQFFFPALFVDITPPVTEIPA